MCGVISNALDDGCFTVLFPNRSTWLKQAVTDLGQGQVTTLDSYEQISSESFYPERDWLFSIFASELQIPCGCSSE